MKNKISFKEVIKNKSLTQFKETKEMVINNYVKDVPVIKKKKDKFKQEFI